MYWSDSGLAVSFTVYKQCTEALHHFIRWLLILGFSYALGCLSIETMQTCYIHRHALAYNHNCVWMQLLCMCITMWCGIWCGSDMVGVCIYVVGVGVYGYMWVPCTYVYVSIDEWLGGCPYNRCYIHCYSYSHMVGVGVCMMYIYLCIHLCRADLHIMLSIH